MGKSKTTIGLCLSGGGHRATLFALGALLYLVDAGRHRDVREISSVSGGSLTNGFLAVQELTLEEMDSTDFEAVAARLARQIAGSPRWWRTTMCGIGLLLLLWCSTMPALISFAEGWWQWPLIYLLVVALWGGLFGPQSGGTFWAWWGTWVYFGLLFSATVFAVAVWFSPLSWHWCLLLSIMIWMAWGWRNRVADLAFRATLCQDKKSGTRHKLLSEIHTSPRHVFCATEMQAGQHAFFSHDLVFIDYFGLGVPGGLPLSTAVQVSANFPVAFPYRMLRATRHEFWPFRMREAGSLVAVGPALKAAFLMLSDGGVYDNMAAAWFLEGKKSVSNLQHHIDYEISQWGLPGGEPADGTPTKIARPPNPLHEVLNDRLGAQIAAVKKDVDILIVINSSPPKEWRKLTPRAIPILGDLLGIYDAQDIMYNQHTIKQAKYLSALFEEKRDTGAVISIEKSPFMPELPKLDESNASQIRDFKVKIDALKTAARTLNAASPEREILQAEMQTLDEKRLQLVLSDTNKLLDDTRKWREERDRYEKQRSIAAGAATTFRPLGSAKSASILQHGYLLCMYRCASDLSGFPHFADPRTIEELVSLAEGIPPNRRPAHLSKKPSREKIEELLRKL